MPQLARWLTYIEQFDYEVLHRPGVQHGNADALSRRPPTVELEESNLVEDELLARKIMNSSNPNEDSLAERQQQDLELGTFVRLRKTQRDPLGPDEIQVESKLTKKFVSRWSQFEVHNDLVYRRYQNTPRGEGDYLQLLMPRVDVPEIIGQCHGGSTGGHACEKKTADQVQRRFFWDQWRTDVQNFCRRCATCARYHRGKP